MSGCAKAIDKMLAGALAGHSVTNDALLGSPDDHAAIVDRIMYHGIAGLLRNFPGAMAEWPLAITAPVTARAAAQAMWELRHAAILNELLREFSRAKVTAMLLKGTAVAYDLYDTPATRDRGDSDVLVHPHDLEQTRLILSRLGFKRVSGTTNVDPFSLQEVWRRTCDRGVRHHVDIHWQLLNSPALASVFPVSECAAHLVSLPRLGPDAVAMNRVRTLIHTCIHRVVSFVSPYYVGGRTYYGGDRLIWLYDIDVLSRALSSHEWRLFSHLALSNGVGSACLDGLMTTQHVLATPIPTVVYGSLRAESNGSAPAAYLRARQFGRAWRDLRAIAGFKHKYDYFVARALPSAEFVRNKYPLQPQLPLALLYARRLVDLFRPRSAQNSEK